MLNYNLVLKSGERFTAGDIETDGSRERATGLYVRDTRHLNQFEINLDGLPPEVLSVVAHDMTRATVICANRLIERPTGHILPQKILVTQEITLDSDLVVEISVQNFDLIPHAFQLGVLFSADFRDMFDIRGFHRAERGHWLQPRAHRRGIDLRYRGTDGVIAGTRISYDRDGTVMPYVTSETIRDGSFLDLMHVDEPHLRHVHHELPAARLSFDLALESHETWQVTLVVSTHVAEGPHLSPAGRSVRDATITTSDHPLNGVLAQCNTDLEALETPFPDGALPAAGVPWFVAPFGRDSIIASLQTLHLAPERAEGTVRTLAALQGKQVNPAREEEPGKILHEMRYGEMARVGEVPHSPYYGSIDATPLWLWLLAETIIWTGDRTLFDDLQGNVRAALDWIDRYGDRDGDGLVEYRTDAHGPGHITHQVWKDSFDSLNHADGARAEGPIAAVEVQAYVFAACDRLAAALPDHEWAVELRSRAGAMREKIESLFWVEEIGCYAQALDAAKRPVAVANSNAGHVLACGVACEERAVRLAERFAEPDMSCGWGIRTLSSDAPSYNPMSYHNGSVWPHDNSLIGHGFYRYRNGAAGNAVTRAMFDAALVMPLFRLPELYCGFPREGIALPRPVPYPVSCSPQAWAAGSLPFLLRGMLGLEVDPTTRELLVRPSLPPWIEEASISPLRVLGAEGTLSVRRTGAGYVIEGSGLPLRLTE